MVGWQDGSRVVGWWGVGWGVWGGEEVAPNVLNEETDVATVLLVMASTKKWVVLGVAV